MHSAFCSSPQMHHPLLHPININRAVAASINLCSVSESLLQDYSRRFRIVENIPNETNQRHSIFSSPVKVHGSRRECGWCGDFGEISSPQFSEKAKLMQEDTSSVQFTVKVTFASDDVEETPRSFSWSELEDMVRRWDFSENE